MYHFTDPPRYLFQRCGILKHCLNRLFKGLMMTKLAFKFCLAACSLIAFASSLQADTYRWVDDSGVVNYSELKPRDVPADRVTLIASEKTDRRAQQSNRRSASTSQLAVVARPVAASNNVDDENLSRVQREMLRNLQQAESGRQQQVARIRQDNCDRSRRALSNLSAKDRIRVRADDGSQRVLPEEERQQRIREAQQGVVVNCDA